MRTPLLAGRRRRTTLVALVTALSVGVSPAVADAACKTYKHRAKVESDPFGTDLAYLNIKVRVCYSGSRITKVGTLDITPTVTKNALGTMKFEGLPVPPVREYQAWKGRRKGSYFVKATGKWIQEVAGKTSRSDTIFASIRIFGNGKSDKKRDNA